jgi:hypothetical protein
VPTCESIEDVDGPYGVSRHNLDPPIQFQQEARIEDVGEAVSG